MPASFTSWTTDGAWRGLSPLARCSSRSPFRVRRWRGRGRSTGPSCGRSCSTARSRSSPASTAGSTSRARPVRPVVAPTDGVVTYAGTPPGNGLTLSIRTPDGYSVTLTHLGSLEVRRGASVEEGAIVARVGASGPPEVDEPYLHLGIRLASDEDGYLDPLSFLPPRPAASPPAPPAPPADGPGCRHGAAACAWRRRLPAAARRPRSSPSWCRPLRRRRPSSGPPSSPTAGASVGSAGRARRAGACVRFVAPDDRNARPRCRRPPAVDASRHARAPRAVERVVRSGRRSPRSRSRLADRSSPSTQRRSSAARACRRRSAASARALRSCGCPRERRGSSDGDRAPSLATSRSLPSAEATPRRASRRHPAARRRAAARRVARGARRPRAPANPLAPGTYH